MPIGKNAIKRVTNNGYLGVKSEAPDMENSVSVEKAPEKKEVAKSAPKAQAKSAPKTTPKSTAKTTKAAPKAAPKKAAPKSAPQKSLEKEPTLAPVNTAKKVVGKECEYFGVGEDLPIYLL